ncbi:MAG: ParB N-terminal domain-containing protein [Clostridia bacterium]|nr:ParB N-terminal domain-containing protein [Clostridia bacterium]MBQ9212217.1 ParB N-terminal domain-containing protein [Clostridia bacterium]
MPQKRIAIVYKLLSELIPDEKNPRRNDAAVPAVVESIREFGFRVPIVIDANDVIRAGHTRYKAAQELNIVKVPCIVASDLNEKQLKAFQLADNKTGELSSWDASLLSMEMSSISELFDMSLFGFNVKKDDSMLDDEGGEGAAAGTSKSDKFVTCPRCGKVFLKSEGHPKTGASFDADEFLDEDDMEDGGDFE